LTCPQMTATIGKKNYDIISQVLNVRITPRIFSCTLRSAVHSKCTCSRVSSRVITADRGGKRACQWKHSKKGGKKANQRRKKGQNSPASPTLKLRDLNGSEPARPWRGGAPGLKKLAKLLPTFHTRTTPSSSETVTNRRPSGEKLHAASALL
jgi:hypothetical protein